MPVRTIEDLQKMMMAAVPEARVAIEMGFERFRLPRDWAVGGKPPCCKIAVMALDNILGELIDCRHEVGSREIKAALEPLLRQAMREASLEICATCEELSNVAMEVRPV